MANPMADEMRRFKGSDEKNPFEAMSERFDRAAQLLGLEPVLYAVLRVPSRELKVY
ncbi:MAG: Glu/Leu/Phe/Val dehydrogenase, partial [Acidobacteria bacterium]|nr:Glu/Leu/Phe/Val dehydrogenase [Acidobacteriota bacterium]